MYTYTSQDLWSSFLRDSKVSGTWPLPHIQTSWMTVLSVAFVFQSTWSKCSILLPAEAHEINLKEIYESRTQKNLYWKHVPSFFFLWKLFFFSHEKS